MKCSSNILRNILPYILFLGAILFQRSSGAKREKPGLDIEKFMKQNLICHNKFREMHGVKALSYHEELNKIAQKYAENLASIDAGMEMVHSKNGYGENLYTSKGLKVDGFSACNSWYDEIKDYNYNQSRKEPDNMEDVGHFTALVWKGSCFMGVGIATSKSGWTYVVTNYDPPGNVKEKFHTNVFRPGTSPESNKNMSPFDLLMSEDKVICSDVDNDTFLKQNLECQNMIRKRHGALPLSYSKEMNEYAQKQAQSWAKTGKLNGNDKYGQIMYYADGGKMEGYSPCKSWYQSSKLYNYNSDDNPSKTFPFTQMVWKSSRLTGIGIVRSKNGELYVFSVYDPPGNFIGGFRQNVLPPEAGMNAITSLQNESTTISLVTKPVKKKSVIDMVKLKEENLICHNNYREKHGVKSLSYNDELNSVAQKYAEILAANDEGLIHSNNEFGENLYVSWGKEVDGFSACNSWYNEIKDYNFDRDQPNNLKKVGHFTAMVWKGSCFMGLGISTSQSGRTYVVTNYDPIGNSNNKFRYNVFQPGTPVQSSKKKSPFESLMSEDEVFCSDADSDTFLKQNLECHNIVRQRHGAPPLSYSKEMNEQAEKVAKSLAKTGKLKGVGNYGVNVYSSIGRKMEGYSSCKMWYNSGKHYDFKSENNPYSTLPFTQMVWKSSHEIGIGFAHSTKGHLFVVGLYNPDFLGKSKKNVLPPSADKNIITPSHESTNTDSTTIQSTEETPETTVPDLSEHESNLKLFRQQNIDCHNKFRRIHRVDPLYYDPEMNYLAQEIVAGIAKTGDRTVLKSLKYGYNLYHSTGRKPSGLTACKMWYKGEQKYPFSSPPDTGNKDFFSFTQMVWKETNITGIGMAKSASGKTYILALYDPSGNKAGLYGDNVKPHI